MAIFRFIASLFVNIAYAAAFRTKNAQEHLVEQMELTVQEMCKTARMSLQTSVEQWKGDADTMNALGASLTDVKDMLQSFSDECIQLSVGKASRSAALFVRSRDEQWVLKKISKEEMGTLLALETDSKYSSHISTSKSLMLPLTHAINHPANPMVIMPNFVTSFKQLSLSLFNDASFEMMKYDVKPIQCKFSAEREPLFERIFTEAWTPATDDTFVCKSDDKSSSGRECWSKIVGMLDHDLKFMNTSRRKDFLGRKMQFIDFSLIFQIATADGEHTPATVDLPPNCAVSIRNGRTSLLCVRLLDYLVEKSLLRKLESTVKANKFADYGYATEQLLSCFGNVRQDDCSEYLAIAYTSSILRFEVGSTVRVSSDVEDFQNAARRAKLHEADVEDWSLAMGHYGRVKARPPYAEQDERRLSSVSDKHCSELSLLVEVPSRFSVCLPAEVLIPRRINLNTLSDENLSKMDRVQLLDDAPALLALCQQACLSEEFNNVRTQCVGKWGTVVGKDYIDGTVLIDVDGLGNLYFPVEAIASTQKMKEYPSLPVARLAGFLMKASGKSGGIARAMNGWQLRWFEVGNGELRWWDNPGYAGNLGGSYVSPKESLQLNNVKVKRVKGSSTKFTLTTVNKGGKVYEFDTDVKDSIVERGWEGMASVVNGQSIHDRGQWMNALQQDRPRKRIAKRMIAGRHLQYPRRQNAHPSAK